MHHNVAIRWHGQCDCPCHTGSPLRCYCAAPAWMQMQIKRRKPRKVNLESRVKAFNRTGSKSAYHSHIIAVSKAHKVHAPRYLG